MNIDPCEAKLVPLMSHAPEIYCQRFGRHTIHEATVQTFDGEYDVMWKRSHKRDPEYTPPQ